MKILILSHNCMSNNNNMGKAMLSLFEKFDKKELCQLYIYPSIPDIDKCNSYYRITDRESLKSLYTFKKYGHEIDKSLIRKSNSLYDNNRDMKILKIKKSNLKSYLRDRVWKLSCTLNDNLKDWLNREKPTHIVAFPGNYCFFYNLVVKIKDYLNIPLITYFCDDYYVSDKNKISNYQRLLNRKISEIITKSNNIITISNTMSGLYSKIFRKNISTIMLGSKQNIKKCNNVLNVTELCNISYIGNVSNHRYCNLIDFGKALDIINNKKKSNHGMVT